jgi:DNA-binding NtrC family response regulator
VDKLRYFVIIFNPSHTCDLSIGGDKAQFLTNTMKNGLPGEVTNTILIVDDTPTNISILFDVLTKSGYKVLVASDGKSALEQAAYALPDLILLDVMMPGMSGFETCRLLKNNVATQAIPVIFMTALTETINKVNGFNMGAVDYITKPFEIHEVQSRIGTHLTLANLRQKLEQMVADRTADLNLALAEVRQLKDQLQAENVYLKEELRESKNPDDIISQSPTFKKVLNKIRQVAPTSSTVLITGESGTGKELLARAVHHLSNRKNRPLIKLNCAALPASLIESELFGHELLRVLQEGEFERVGSTRTLKVNVRIIAATNRDLEKEIAEQRFREDLYYRLNVFPVFSIPLRERKEDIPLLVNHFCAKHGADQGKVIDNVPQKVLDILSDYHWPGNIRELENVVERSIIMSPGRTLLLDDWSPRKPANTAKGSLMTMEECEREHILFVLGRTNWKVSGKNGAAQILDMVSTTLDSRMRKLGIKRPDQFPL